MMKQMKYNIISRLDNLIPDKLKFKISAIIEANAGRSSMDRLEKYQKLLQDFPAEWQLGLTDRMLKTTCVGNSFFKDMETNLIARLLQGFQLLTLDRGEFLYTLREPTSHSSRLLNA
jgi:hypothetical protein